MKYVYILALVAIVVVALTNDTLRGFIFSSPSESGSEETAVEERAGGRAGEMDSASELSRDTSR